MEHPSAYRNREVVILGLARSGVAVAKLFHEFGAKVVVNDKKDRSQCPEASELEALGISVICGYHPDELVHSQVSLVVKNPGIPYSIDPIQKALAEGIEVVTEVEVAYRITQAPIVGITGSNGKTTTTTWIGLIFEEAGLKPIVAGNIGRSLCDASLDAKEDNWMIVELSSFQLKGTDAFRPRIACLLNLYETHLDYHGSMEDYGSSKAKLLANQLPEDTAVLNWDDSFCRSLIPTVSSSVLPFSIKETLAYGVYLEDGRSIVYKDREGTVHRILDAEELGIPGSFNVENALAAVAVAMAAGIPAEPVRKVLKEFRGVEHRLEYVADKNGIQFYNNSKATNPQATIKAIEAFKQPIVLIAGGLDRGSDYMELLPYFKDQVKAVVTLGETRDKINKVALTAGLDAVKSVDNGDNASDTVRAAVEAAYRFADRGDVVLLSPACASWDMFPSYEERGRIFKESVHNL